jgi:fermentation-respiration switch protein FrsA (DUF1100 family)
MPPDRRVTAPQKMRPLFVRLGVFALAAAIVVYGGVSLYAANVFTLVERHQPDASVPGQIGGAYEPVSFRTSDGLVLRGWLFPRGDRAVVMVHGKESVRLNGPTSIGLAKLLTANGYTVLAFDLRGNGESEGDRFSLGQYERLDVAASVAYLGSRGFPVRRVALFGESMGAGTVLQTLAVRSDVGAVIADSAYASGATVVEEGFAKESGLPSFFVPGVLLAARLFALDVTQIEPVAQVRAHPERPFLFIHCEADDIVLVHHSRDLMAASANADSTLWIVPGCGHVKAFETEQTQYASRVLAFLASQLR